MSQAALATRCWALGFRVEPYASGFQGALLRPPGVRAECVALGLPKPRVLRGRLEAAPPAVRSFGFAQPEETAWRPRGSASPRPAGASRTRLRSLPEGVKTQDRLYYLLQPALEDLLGGALLDMPFRPFPYQLEGVAFLVPRHAAVLADEMGLGKTMQAITSLRVLFRMGEIRSALLVCPKPLVSNWQREFQNWAPELPVCAIEGDQARRRWLWLSSPAPVKIANYELLVRDAPLVQSGRLEFDLVALDESQRIKNRHGTTSQTVRSLRRRRSWALTGTPIENGAEDLVGIFEFLQPGYLRSDLDTRRMAQRVQPYVLRRTKEQVLTDLPPKLFRDGMLELTPEQRASYLLAEEQGVLRLSKLGSGATIQHVLELIVRLKQICNFDTATGASCKFERLWADLEEVVSSGRKAVVFSQWVATLRTLAARITSTGVAEFHGQVSMAERRRALERFRDDPQCQVLLVSYGAGGVGLNLQFARYAFLFDRWWNPAVEDQAINRVHRIGTGGPVTITRYLVRDTIEERIDAVLREKRELFAAVFRQTQMPTDLGLSRQEIFKLFQLRCPDAAAA